MTPSSKATANSFIREQRVLQGDWFDAHLKPFGGFAGAPYRMAPPDRLRNLAPEYQVIADDLFVAKPRIQWHRHSSHGLSSQACCLNFLLPFADKKESLRRWIEHVTHEPVAEVLPIEPDRAGRQWYITFEWIGGNYLNESKENGARTRGANSTAADAAALYRDPEGRTHLLQIEWKYTERYGQAPDPSRTAERRRRYENIFRAPIGPIRHDAKVELENLFYEPFYQMLRQQMLAWHTERLDPKIDRARVLHLSPAGNRALHSVTSPALKTYGEDAFAVFRSLLTIPQDFISMSIEAAFAPLANWPEADWYPWLCNRYASLCAPLEVPG